MQGTDVRSTLVHPQLELACAGVEEVMNPCASIHGDIELPGYVYVLIVLEQTIR